MTGRREEEAGDEGEEEQRRRLELARLTPTRSRKPFPSESVSPPRRWHRRRRMTSSGLRSGGRKGGGGRPRGADPDLGQTPPQPRVGDHDPLPLAPRLRTGREASREGGRDRAAAPPPSSPALLGALLDGGPRGPAAGARRRRHPPILMIEVCLFPCAPLECGRRVWSPPDRAFGWQAARPGAATAPA